MHGYACTADSDQLYFDQGQLHSGLLSTGGMSGVNHLPSSSGGANSKEGSGVAYMVVLNKMLDLILL